LPPGARAGVRFAPGDHLRVRRWLGYWHHGICVDDGHVIQFGGSISHKPQAAIQEVPLSAFERRGTAFVVAHGRTNRLGMWLPAADPPELVVFRARWLLEHQPARWYHVVGWNCEHAANFCVNEFTESLQVRTGFGVHGLIGGALLLWVAWRSRTSPIRRSARSLIFLFDAFGIVAIVTYNLRIRRFWREVGRRWRVSEDAERSDSRPAV
jgi:hypothetical protein